MCGVEKASRRWAACSGRYGGPAAWPKAQRLESVAAEHSELVVSWPLGCISFSDEIQRATIESDRGRAGGQLHNSGVRQQHGQHQMTVIPYYGMHIDDILLAMSSNNRGFHVRWVSAQLDQLLQAGNLQPAPLALHDMGGVWGQYHPHWPPQFVDLRALNSIFDSALVGYSYLRVTLNNTLVWLSEVEAERCHTAAALGPH